MIEKLLESFYVDDFLSGSSNEEQAKELFLQAKKCLTDDGFTLRKWKTSSPELREFISECDQSVEERPGPSTPLEEKPIIEDEIAFAKLNLGDNAELKEDCDKLLGLPWNYKSDEFVLQFQRLIELSKNLSPTKRNLLKMTATLFDPLGLISPSIVQMKMILQDVCLLELDWDSPLPNKLIETLCRCLNEFEKVGHLRIERCYLSRIEEEIKSYSLHGFCDASKKAYCAVIYLVITMESEGLFSKLIVSRSRVAPIKKLTTLRLELMAAVILAHRTCSAEK